MKITSYNIEFMYRSNKISRDEALVALEAAVREIDQSLHTDLLSAAETVADYETYEQLRQAACLVRLALNNLYTKIKGA